MIKGSHHVLYEKFFDLYLGWITGKDFHDHRIIIPDGDKTTITAQLAGHSILMIGNHFSWWDGFIARHVSKQLLKRRLYVMMLEDQLRSRMFLSRIGAFSIRQNHRSAVESLHYAAGLLRDPANVVVMFPQGKFQSVYHYPLDFENGWFRALKMAAGHTKVVFMANLVDYFSNRKPSLNTYLHAVETALPDASAVEQAYNLFMKEAVEQQGRFQ